MKTHIGKTQIQIHSEGCTDCGVKWSWLWVRKESIPVSIGDKSSTITIYACGDCAQAEKPPLINSNESKRKPIIAV